MKFSVLIFYYLSSSLPLRLFRRSKSTLANCGNIFPLPVADEPRGTLSRELFKFFLLFGSWLREDELLDPVWCCCPEEYYYLCCCAAVVVVVPELAPALLPAL